MIKTIRATTENKVQLQEIKILARLSPHPNVPNFFLSLRVQVLHIRKIFMPSLVAELGTVTRPEHEWNLVMDKYGINLNSSLNL